MKTRQCDECKFFNPWRATIHPASNLCQNGHRPRFYTPLDPLDWGWKRRCEEFKPRDGEEGGRP